ILGNSIPGQPTQLYKYKKILGLWQLDAEHYRTLVNVVVDGLCITGWKYRLSSHTHMGGPVHFNPSFRIRLTKRKQARLECMEGRQSRPHNRHLQIQKDRFTTQCKNTDHRTDFSTGVREEWVLEDRQRFDWLTYCRLYLPPSHPDNLIRPGLFQYDYDACGLMIAMLSFHGKYARVTKITGVSNKMLEIHLMRRIKLRDGEIFRNFNQLSRVVQEIEEQVIREQQQQQEDGTEESMGHSWQSPAQPRVGESRASISEEQPVPFVLPEGVVPRDWNYPRTCRMCFLAWTLLPLGSPDRWRFPGVFILFDENHFGFISLEVKSFFLWGRVQNTFQNAEAPSPQAFLEMLKNIQSLVS
uniref:F-box protein 31 n=1 Tax=Myotis lucifugus TaxID=59463 RepID=G1QDD8_MYOLU